MMHEFLSKQFLVFLLTGGTAAAVNFGSRIVYCAWVDFSTAVILAYVTGMVTAFILAKLFVFRQSRRTVHRAAFFFCLVNLGAVIQTWLVSVGSAYYVLPALGLTRHVLEIAHAVGVAVPVFTSYIGHKRWSFR